MPAIRQFVIDQTRQVTVEATSVTDALRIAEETFADPSLRKRTLGVRGFPISEVLTTEVLITQK